MKPDHYELLGVPRHAPADLIGRAHRSRLKRLDAWRSEGRYPAERIESLKRATSIAFDTLIDPDRRAAYDAQLEQPRARPTAQTPAVERPSREPALWFAGLFLLLAALALLAFAHYRVSVDLAYWTQAAWLISHGRRAYMTYRAMHFLGDHANFVFYPMAYLTRPFPIPPALLVMQSAALAAGVFPLWGLARRFELTRSSTRLLLALYCVYPALQNVNLSDFHPEVVAVPFLLWAILWGIQGRALPFAGAAAVVMLSKEDLPLTIAALGVLLAVTGRRRLGLAAVGASLVWLYVLVSFIQPHFAEGQLVNAALLGRYGSGPLGILSGLLTHPGQVLSELFTAANGILSLKLLVPLALLPLLRPPLALPALPILLLNFLSAREGAHSIDNQYTVGIIGPLFAATAAAMAALRPARITKRALGVVFAIALGSAIAWAKPSTEAAWTWLRTDDVHRAQQAALRVIPPGASVSVGDRVAAITANRAEVYRFPNPFIDYPRPLGDPVPLDRRLADVTYVFVDTTDPIQWTGYHEDSLRRLQDEQGFVRVFERAGVLVLRRPPPAGR